MTLIKKRPAPLIRISCLIWAPFILIVLFRATGLDYLSSVLSPWLIFLFPSVFLSLLFRRRGLEYLALSIVFNVFIQAGNITILKILLGSAHSIPFLALNLMEAALFTTILFFRSPPIPNLSGRGALLYPAISIAVIALYSAGLRGSLFFELHDLWYFRGLDGEEGEGLGENDDVSISISGKGVEAVQDRLFRPGKEVSITLKNRGFETPDFPLFLLIQGDIGTAAILEEGGEILFRAEITTHVTEVEEEGPVLRYTERGIAPLFLPIPLSPGERSFVLRFTPPAPGTLLYDLSNLSREGVLSLTSDMGLHHTHYYQILNIAENLLWAEEVRGGRFLTIHQPPLFSYIHAVANLAAMEGLFPLSILLAAVVFLIFLFLNDIFLTLRKRVKPIPSLILLFICLSHLKIMALPGSINFPDNLYTLFFVISLHALIRGRPALFSILSVCAVLCRYAGAPLALIVASLHTAIFPKGGGNGSPPPPSSRRVLPLTLVSLGLLALCGMGAGLLSGAFKEWLSILNFETFFEHFHGDYNPSSLLPRPLEFYPTLFKYSGYLPLFLPLTRGRVPALLLATGLLYSLPLSLVDHFPSHYFLPLLHIISLTVVLSLDSPRYLRFNLPLLLLALALSFVQAAGMGRL